MRDFFVDDLASHLIGAGLDRQHQRREQITKEAEKLQAAAKFRPSIPFYDFVRESWPIIKPGKQFRDNWHIGAIVEHLDAVAKCQIRNLVINVPPGFMKSTLTCVQFPAWLWTEQPWLQTMFSSYHDKLSTRDSVSTRDLILSNWYQSNWGDRFRLKGDQNQKEKFANDRTGFRLSTVVSGFSTGEHVDIAVTDDPHNVMEVESKTRREEVVKWFTEAYSTRWNDPLTFRLVVIMQRLAENDLCGTLLKQDGWDHLMVPMRYDPKRSKVTSIGWKDPRDAEGQLAWPEHLPEPELKKKEAPMTDEAVSCQFQQDPQSPKGNLFKREFIRYATTAQFGGDELKTWEKYFKGTKNDLNYVFECHRSVDDVKRFLAAECWFIQYVDTAMKTGQENDYTAVLTGAITPEADLIIFDVWRDKVIIPKQYETVINQRRRFPFVTTQKVESKNSGEGVIQTGDLMGTPFEELKAVHDKVQRATSLSTLYARGKVFHLQGAPWLDVFETELLYFPKGEHDDMVDCAVYAAIDILETFMNAARVRKF